MGKHDGGRLAVILVAVFLFLLSIGINALAVPGISPIFTTDTANVSAVFDTPITPIGWTFQIWALIYTWLIVMHGYILSTTCRKNANGYVYCSPAVLPYGLFVSWSINMCFNCGWLFVWDRGVMIAAMVFLVLVICTNYAVIGFSCHGLHLYGAWLNKYHRVELWLIRVLVQNGVALYSTWTTIATHINLAIVLIYEVEMSPTDAATVTLSVLSVVLLVWFILENFVIEKHVRYIVTIYPVVIWALTGNVVKNYDATSPSRSAIFIVVLLAAACLMFAIRIVLVIWRHVKQPLYEDVSSESMSPMEIAEKQKNIFC